MFSKEKEAHCIFNYIYLHDELTFSSLSVDVHEARVNMGKALAKQLRTGVDDADIVASIPASSISAATGYAQESGIPHVEIMVRKPATMRSFLMPTQEERDKAIDEKFEYFPNWIKDKRICLVDDSIVRGSVSKKVIKKLREFGAKEIHFRIVCPPVLYPCDFAGTHTKEELISNKFNKQELCKLIGADSLEFLDLDRLAECCFGTRHDFCHECFSGEKF